MKKYILALVLVFGLQSMVYAVDVCVTIPSAKVAVATNAMLKAHPMPQVNNDNGTPLDTEDDFMEDEFTDLVWFRILIKSMVVDWIWAYRHGQEIDTAQTTAEGLMQNDITGIN